MYLCLVLDPYGAWCYGDGVLSLVLLYGADWNGMCVARFGCGAKYVPIVLRRNPIRVTNLRLRFQCT